MSKFAVKAIVGAALALASTAGFSVTESATLQVSARIGGGCVLSTSGPMAFGDLSLTSGANETKQVIVTYKCASGLNVSALSVGGETDGDFGGSMANTSGPSDTIPYSITWSALAAAGYTSTGFANVKNITLTGTILNADYNSKAPGNYAESVLLSINY
jgi:spore coat protein U-like protein